MEFLVVWLGGALIAGVIASNKGRSGLGFFLLALLLSPLIGIIAALIVRSDKTREAALGPVEGETDAQPAGERLGQLAGESIPVQSEPFLNASGVKALATVAGIVALLVIITMVRT